jgi:hypothetical protein
MVSQIKGAGILAPGGALRLFGSPSLMPSGMDTPNVNITQIPNHRQAKLERTGESSVILNIVI